MIIGFFICNDEIKEGYIGVFFFNYGDKRICGIPYISGLFGSFYVMVL